MEKRVPLVGSGPFAGAGYVPGVGWGRVCVEGTGVAVRTVAGRFMAGETIVDIADDYHLPAWKVEDCLRLFLVSLRGQHGEKVEDSMRSRLNARARLKTLAEQALSADVLKAAVEMWNSLPKGKFYDGERPHRLRLDILEALMPILEDADAALARVTVELETVKAQRDGLANFNPDWDMLAATQQSLREHMALVRDANTRAEAAEADAAALRERVKELECDYSDLRNKLGACASVVIRLRGALDLCATPEEGWPEVECADAYEASRRVVPEIEGDDSAIDDALRARLNEGAE